MPSLQEQFDDAVFEFSMGHCDAAIAGLKSILEQDPEYYDALLALGGAYCAKGDYDDAIAAGHQAEKIRPNDQWAHTNLSRAYMKAGNKGAAEHHAAQAKLASWRGNMAPPDKSAVPSDSELPVARPVPPAQP